MGEEVKALAKKDLESLARIVGAEHVSARTTDRIFYSHDRMSRTTIQSRRQLPEPRPHAVVWPGNTAEVASLVRWALRRRLPVIPFGGGSGVSGGTIPVRGGLSIDLKRLQRIESIDDAKRLAVVEAGILLEDLDDRLRARGYTQGHIPSSVSIATLGGSIAARGAGQLSTKYGVIEDMVDAVEVVLPDGHILPLGAKQIPKLPGVNPVSLFTGSEGTLGLITRARVRLHPLPEAATYRGLSFVRLHDALTAIRRIMQSGLRPSVLRLYDPLDSLLLQWGYERGLPGGVAKLIESLAKPVLEPALKLLRPIKNQLKEHALEQFLAHPRWVDFLLHNIPTNCILILAFEGDEKMIAAQEEEARRLCQEVICRDEGRAIGEHWLRHRFSVSYKMPVLFDEGSFVDTIEVAGTWDCLEKLYHEMRTVIARDCLVMAHFSHAYPEGCSIYFTFIGSESQVKEELKVYDRVWNNAMEACMRVGGTISHHHGIGLLKAQYMKEELGPLLGLFRNFKKKLDPYGVMNPGKLGLDDR